VETTIRSPFGLDELYEGKTEVDGEIYDVNEDADPEGRAPFKALLDVGLKRTTTGARIFGALKGASDGGLHVPHKDRRFPGSTKSEEEGKKFEPNPEKHREYIFGLHVANYMKILKKEDPESFAKQFRSYNDAKIGPDDIEGTYKKLHAAIRKDPNVKRGALERGHYGVRKEPKKEGAKYPPIKHKKHRTKVSNSQRKARVTQILTKRFQKQEAAKAQT